MERRWQVLIAVSVAVFVVFLDLFIVNIAFPDIRSDFDGASVASVSWVLNAYAIVFAALLVPAGRLADRIGRRRIFLTGLTVFVAASALCAAAPSVEALVAARVLQAIGAAMLMPTSLALLLREFPPQQRATAIGIWAAVGGVAAAAGPPIGGLLVEASWRLVFLVNLPVGLLAGAYAVRLLRESRDEESAPPDLIGTVLLTLAIAAIALGLVQAPEWGWGDARTLAGLAGGAVGVALFLLRCATHPAPAVDLSMLRVRSYAFANAASLLFGAAFAAMLLGNVLFLTSVWGDSVLEAGLSVSPGPLMAAATAVPAGKASNRVGQRWLASVGSVVFAAGCAWWLWQLDGSPDYASELLPGMLLTGLGVGLTISPLSSAAAASLPPARFATGAAVLTMSRQLGTVAGISIFVAVLGTPSAAGALEAFDGGFRFMIVAALLASLSALAIGKIAAPHAAPAGAPAAVAAEAGA